MSFRIDTRGTIIMIGAMICIALVLRYTLGNSVFYYPAFFTALILVLIVGNWKWLCQQFGRDKGGNDYFQ